MTISSSSTSTRLLKYFNLLLLLLLVVSTTAQVQINDFEPFKYQLAEKFSPVKTTELEQAQFGFQVAIYIQNISSNQRVIISVFWIENGIEPFSIHQKFFWSEQKSAKS